MYTPSVRIEKSLLPLDLYHARWKLVTMRGPLLCVHVPTVLQPLVVRKVKARHLITWCDDLQFPFRWCYRSYSSDIQCFGTCADIAIQLAWNWLCEFFPLTAVSPSTSSSHKKQESYSWSNNFKNKIPFEQSIFPHFLRYLASNIGMVALSYIFNEGRSSLFPFQDMLCAAVMTNPRLANSELIDI